MVSGRSNERGRYDAYRRQEATDASGRTALLQLLEEQLS